MLSSINSKIQKYIYFLQSQYKTQKHYLSLLSSSLHAILAYLFLVCIFTSSLHYLLSFILFLHLVLDKHFVMLRTKTSNICFVGNQKMDRKIIPSLLIPREFDIKPLWGKHVFHLLHTLQFEAQSKHVYFSLQVASRSTSASYCFLAPIRSYHIYGYQGCFLAPLPGNHS